MTHQAHYLTYVSIILSPTLRPLPTLAGRKGRRCQGPNPWCVQREPSLALSALPRESLLGWRRIHCQPSPAVRAMALQRGPYAHAVHKHTATSRTLTSPLNSCSLRRAYHRTPRSFYHLSPHNPHPSHRIAPTIPVVLDAMRGNTMRGNARRPRGMVCAFSRTYVFLHFKHQSRYASCLLAR